MESTTRTNRVERLRAVQKMNRPTLAGMLDVSEATVIRWERGQKGIPEKYWGPLSEIFGVSVVYLLGLEDDSNDDDSDAVERVA